MVAIKQSVSFTIRSIQITDIPTISRIHCQQFPISRSTSLGKPFVRKMYLWFTINQPGLSLLAEQDGETVGFVVGSIGGYGRKIFRYAFPEIVLGFVLNPCILFRSKTFLLWKSYLKGLFPVRQNPAPVTPSPLKIYAGLGSIAVEKSAQGKGIGKALVYAFEKAAWKHGAEIVGLSVEVENIAAQRMYESSGWIQRKQTSNQTSFAYYKNLM